MSQEGHYHHASQSVHLITGATSLLGAEFVHAVLTFNNSTRCALLIRAKKQTIAEIRANDLLHYLFGRGEQFQLMRRRVDVYCGDVTKKHFGLSDFDWSRLLDTTRYIFHAAANSNLAASEDTLKRVNVLGTVSVLNFALQCKNLTRLMHVSSAYVSGTKTGQLSPDELDMKQPVSDNFQLSKRIAEKLVRKYLNKLPIVIVRPSTLVGHSQLGRTSTYKAFYYPTRMLFVGHRIFFPASRDGKVEAIPADWAANMTLKILYRRGINGRCLHLTMGDRAYTMDQIKRIILKSFDKQGAEYKSVKIVPRLPYKLFIAPLISILHPDGRKLNKDFKLLANYTCLDRVFDNSDTFRATGVDRNTLPGLEGYYSKLYKYATENRWRSTLRPD